MKFNYEHLETTELIHRYIKLIYQITDGFPKSEKFGLTAQAKRSATSILLNLAEGSSRASKPEFIRFLNISLGSLVETDAVLKLAVTLQFIPDDQRETIDDLQQKIFYKLIALKKYLKRTNHTIHTLHTICTIQTYA